MNSFDLSFRSLVALSLILAMLLLKPAPIYILDEVDAALDLSHTQNIGGMLREHFKHSQVQLMMKHGTDKQYGSLAAEISNEIFYAQKRDGWPGS